MDFRPAGKRSLWETGLPKLKNRACYAFRESDRLRYATRTYGSDLQRICEIK
ncbi:MAG: hypothetical protein F6K32_08750 [Desertifilum sp. SIO1I2]|nr:hypothetical protein [Desertifilum sp. SIO1I2]